MDDKITLELSVGEARFLRSFFYAAVFEPDDGGWARRIGRKLDAALCGKLNGGALFEQKNNPRQ